MAGRTTGNKRQREMLRKERQAQKLTRRDERRTKRIAGDGLETLAASADEPPSESALPGESDPVAPDPAPQEAAQSVK